MAYDIIIGRDLSDKQKFGDKGLIYIGKGYVKMGNYTSLSNKIWMDIARSHVVLVSGKRGSGKCVHGDTLIALADGSQIPIKDLENNQEKVISLNEKLKIEQAEKSDFFSRTVNKLLRVKLRSGKEIKLTPEHPLLTIKGWQEAQNLQIGSRIATPRKLDCFENRKMPKHEIKPPAESDIFWDEITSMELLEGEFKVYDICVPKNHNFVANGIIVHNSYTLGAIAEELANLPQENAKNIASIIFDTMGIFWTMKYKNEKDRVLLDEWGLKSKELPAIVFVPFGKVSDYEKKGIPIDKTFALKASELEPEDWITVFNLPMTSLPGVLIERIITDLKEKRENFTLTEIAEAVEKDIKAAKEAKDIVSSLFNAADSWGIFSKTQEGTEVPDLVNAGTSTVLDLSVYSSIGAFNVRALVISLISRKIFKNRMDARKKEEMEAIQHGQEYLEMKSQNQEPLVWMFIDEIHEFLDKNEKSPATDALIQLLREGRQPGISLVMATQQPGKLHADAMTQADIVISHRVTAKPDIDSLNNIMQSYLLESIKQHMDNLPALKGSAILLDDNSERIYSIRIRPRFTWHGGEAPVSIKAEMQI
jgi:hypothetical protein